ncbi:MAG: hypothetical protein RLZZ196_2924 [Bacteroidota bacterium]|jgi:hypothetical protein
MKAQEFLIENSAIEMTPELENLVAKAEMAGNKMAASRTLRYQLYIPRTKRSLEEDLKPKAKLWTSTAEFRGNNSYTSAWAEWCYYNMPGWLSPTGQLYQVQPGARVLNIGSDAAAKQIAKLFNRDFSAGKYTILQSYPWEELSKLVDGIRYPARLSNSYSSGRDNILMSLWDVESTAWFNTEKLQLIKEVNIKTREW